MTKLYLLFRIKINCQVAHSDNCKKFFTRVRNLKLVSVNTVLLL